MAIRNIIFEGDDVLRKKCRTVEKFDSRLHTLLDDMRETLYDAAGVGLAAPQVGVLKRIALVDVGDGLCELINPVIVKSSGENTDVEACLSCPGLAGYVVRPKKVTVQALNRNGEIFSIEGEGLKARALCHEIDHLDGILFLDKAIEIVNVNDVD